MRKYLFSTLTKYCGKPLNMNMSEEPVQYKWDFYHSLFFVITVVSTIGYGNLAPTTMMTRIFMIFYGLVGIPMNGIVIYTLGDFFGRSFTKLHQRWKNSKLEAKIDYDTTKLGLIGQVILYLVPGFTFFIFLPSTIMTVFEGWEYDVSVYYSFVSLTTIGFGDYVAGVEDPYEFGPLYTVYQIFLLVWIVGGMGYVVMILSFITNGMQSKRIKQIEHMLSENIKNTPKRIRTELRTLLQELLFMRVKPVYKGEFEYTPSRIERSQSCPNFTIYKTESPTSFRKRAMSECYKTVTFQRVQSETDLERIDKERTFKPTNDLLMKTELLFKVCHALSNESIQKQQEIEDGIHGFSDKSILASEYYEPTQVKPKRRRAISDIRPPSVLLHEAINGNTWYGDDAEHALQEYRKRQRAKSVLEVKKPEKENFFRKIRNRLMSRDESNNYHDVEKQPISDQESKTDSQPNLYIRRDSLLSPSNKQDQILEETSIADFIRALSAISTSEDLEASESRSTSPKARRQGIVIAHNRRASLIPDLHPPESCSTQRRFSLKPSEESLLKDVVKREHRKKKISVGFQHERRGSLLSEASGNIPPTLEENVVFGKQIQEPRSRKVSIVRPPDPVSSVVSGATRHFSVRPTNLTGSVMSPVQKQLQKRERTDSGSK